jgi:uncharacterized repeat protein (TIGR01451 family)
MTRRWFELAGGIVLCNLLVALAVAQDSTEKHTLFGNWFGRHDTASSQQTGRTSPQSGKVQQMSDGTQRTSPTDQMPPDPATSQSDALPGLGGSPLPNKTAQSATSGTAAKGGAKSPTAHQNTPANGGQRYNTSSPSARRNAVRQLDISAPTGPPPSPTTNNSNSSPSISRESPSRRTTPHVNANDLRNELSGSFTSPTTPAGEPSARTARADEHAITPTLPPAAATTTKTIAEPIAAPTSITPPATPVVEQPKPEVRPAQAEPRSAAEAFGATKESHPGVGASNFVRTPYTNALPAGPQTSRGKEAFGEALQVASGGDPSVLASNQTPILAADIRGPKQILIGRESLYRVRLQNQSDIPAEGIVATVRIPTGVDIQNATATQGLVQQSQDTQAKGQLQWQISRLDRHTGETLELRLIPRESRPLELGITWTVAPIGSRAVVEVQEPKLQLEIAGPNEVFFDKPQVFKLTINNPGTGPAENVKIELIPPGGAKDGAAKEAVTSHPLGDLPPGGSQTVEVELTAREAGKMFVKATASAEGGLVCNSSKEVFCRKPELEVDWRGPATKYAGTLATYFLRVRNPGTAPAEDVTVKATLPDGADFTSASEGQVFDTQLREVAWHVGTLRPGDDNYMELKCVLKTAGTNQLKITAATASGALTDTKTAATNVVALADLKLDVIDPSGPVAVGSSTMYEIHIKNRGASSAKDVNVVGLFSEGIEPEQAEGAMYTVADGRVSFKAIEDLPAGRDVVLRIRAHAVQPGTHVFRAEVLCRELDIKLATEETTRFYNDDVTPDSGKPEKQSAVRGDAFKPTVR